MRIKMDCRQYFEYLAEAAQAIREQKDYITELDAAIADGDHWLNITIGFDKLLKERELLTDAQDFQEFFKNLAMAVMSAMGGTSGALYGSSYLASAKVLGGVRYLEEDQIGIMLNCWSQALMKCGNTKLGDKTMVDAVYPASVAYTQAISKGNNCLEALIAMKEKAWEGAENTIGMEAAKGRASNQPGKGVGHLDPGAVTMAIQLGCLAEYLINHCLEE